MPSAAIGGGLVTVAAVIGSVPLFLVALVLNGAGSATNLQARYAGADLALPERRGTAVSTVLVATTLGAVAGPNIVGPVGDVAERIDIPALAGPFALAGIAYALAALVLFAMLRPDPLLSARAFAAEEAGPEGVVRQATDRVALRLGGIIMVVTQLVMVAIMTMTPVHMRDHGHGLGATGFVIGLHIAAMFLPSPVTGRLADRFGPAPVAVGAALSLVLAGVVAAVAPADSMGLLALALVLLGLGWNLGLLAGTALVAGAVGLDGRAKVQGRLDVAVALAGATGGLSSGMIVSATSFSALSAGSSVLALVVLAAVVRR